MKYLLTLILLYLGFCYYTSVKWTNEVAQLYMVGTFEEMRCIKYKILKTGCYFDKISCNKKEKIWKQYEKNSKELKKWSKFNIFVKLNRYNSKFEIINEKKN